MEEVVPAPEPRPRFSALSLLAGLPCAVVPLYLCWHGYGAYMRLGWFMVVPILIGVSCAPLWIRSKANSRLILVFLGFALLSWAAGVQARQWRCESKCRAVEPAIEALRKYKADHGSFPTQLAQVPEVQELAEQSGISIRQGWNQYNPSNVGFFGGPDLVVYLWSEDYWCVVPLERPVIMSFTRFYVLRKDSHSPAWREDHIVWTLGDMIRRT